jgi:ribonuclease HII
VGYYLGIDEAGYAPNLGPLVIAVTLWRVPGSPRQSIDLYERLAGSICREPPRANGKSKEPHGCARPGPLTIADSKLLYTPRLGLAALEHGVLSMLRASGSRPKDWFSLWDAVAATSACERDAQPWHDGFNPRLPVVAARRAIRLQVPRLKQGLREARVRLVAVRAAVIFPARFNALVEQFGSKGAALSHQTIELLSDALSLCKQSPVLVVGDKHGGRNFYGRFLQERFPDHLVEIHGEAANQSIYRFGPPRQRIEVRFRAHGEELLPVAMASMVAKYLRELSMRAFNQFWCQRVPRLRSTAGYPRDAIRFKREIEPAQAALGIDDQVLWRVR